MLISFGVKNYLCFKQHIVFSMEKTKARNFSTSIKTVAGNKILPISAIYGYNSSGKTAFFKSLAFVINLVTKAKELDAPIGVIPFALCKDSVNEPSVFEIKFSVKNNVYLLCFSANNKEIIEEKLVQYKSSREIVLYRRNKNKLEFGSPLTEENYANIVRNNQLFLTTCVLSGGKRLLPIYNWFKHTIVLVGPEEGFSPSKTTEKKGYALNGINRLLNELDTGIYELKQMPVDVNSVPMSESFKDFVKQSLKEGTSIRNPFSPAQDVLLTKRNGDIHASVVKTVHKDEIGNQVAFSLRSESDGTRRLIDLAPILAELLYENKIHERVIFIDEFDRRLNPLLTHEIIRKYLCGCDSDSKTQFIFTCHDAALIDADIMRRDEYWIVRKNEFGASSISRIGSQAKIRFDLDLRKAYLDGRLGINPSFTN